MKNLQLSLKKQWFEMTKSGIKTEDYREINEYWFKRLIKKDNFELFDNFVSLLPSVYELEPLLKYFETNTMTLGYPKAGNTERIIKLKHAGIEIRTGKIEWGAEPNKIYFVIKHGSLAE